MNMRTKQATSPQEFTAGTSHPPPTTAPLAPQFGSTNNQTDNRKNRRPTKKNNGGGSPASGASFGPTLRPVSNQMT